MSKIPRFAEYAAAFEKAYRSDDWSLVEPFFTKDAVYEVHLDPPMGGRFEGREAILAYFRRVLDGFDRRFDSREVGVVKGPVDRDGTVWVRGSATYRAEGCPELRFELEEIARFEGEHISHLEDRYDAADRGVIERYTADHGEKLGLGLD